MSIPLSEFVSTAFGGYSELLDKFPVIAVMGEINPVVKDFILFCIQRQGAGWPALYDEMCRVAGSRTFRGLGYNELKTLGLSFGLTDIGKTIRLVDTIVKQRQELAA